jgi:hypothetical protein
MIPICNSFVSTFLFDVGLLDLCKQAKALCSRCGVAKVHSLDKVNLSCIYLDIENILIFKHPSSQLYLSATYIFCRRSENKAFTCTQLSIEATPSCPPN